MQRCRADQGPLAGIDERSRIIPGICTVCLSMCMDVSRNECDGVPFALVILVILVIATVATVTVSPVTVCEQRIRLDMVRM